MGSDEPASVAAVFDNLNAAENFLKTVKEADLGLSVNISTSIEGARKCCKFAGIEPHSIGYSLGFEGKTEKLPNTQILALTTMCGHGMISSSMGKKMIDWVKGGPPHSGRSGHVPGTLLLVRNFQPVTRQAYP